MLVCPAGAAAASVGAASLPPATPLLLQPPMLLLRRRRRLLLLVCGRTREALLPGWPLVAAADAGSSSSGAHYSCWTHSTCDGAGGARRRQQHTRGRYRRSRAPCGAAVLVEHSCRRPYRRTVAATAAAAAAAASSASSTRLPAAGTAVAATAASRRRCAAAASLSSQPEQQPWRLSVLVLIAVGQDGATQHLPPARHHAHGSACQARTQRHRCLADAPPPAVAWLLLDVCVCCRLRLTLGRCSSAAPGACGPAAGSSAAAARRARRLIATLLATHVSRAVTAVAPSGRLLQGRRRCSQPGIAALLRRRQRRVIAIDVRC